MIFFSCHLFTRGALPGQAAERAEEERKRKEAEDLASQELRAEVCSAYESVFYKYS